MFIIFHRLFIFPFKKGTTGPLLGSGICSSLQFGVNNWTKRLLQSNSIFVNYQSTVNFAAGATAGLANSLICGPLEHIRIKQQINTQGFLSFWQVALGILKESGIKGLFRGQTMVLVREAIGMGVYFSSYAVMKEKMKTGKTIKLSSETFSSLIAGGWSGLLYWLSVYPIDLFKSKIQADSILHPTYKGIFSLIQSLHKEWGWRGYFKGIWPCLLRALPVNAVAFLVYEKSSRLLEIFS